jgi:hypothetical protein
VPEFEINIFTFARVRQKYFFAHAGFGRKFFCMIASGPEIFLGA